MKRGLEAQYDLEVARFTFLDALYYDRPLDPEVSRVLSELLREMEEE